MYPIIKRRIELSGHLRGWKPSLIAILLILISSLWFYSIDRDIYIVYIGLAVGLIFAIPTSIVHRDYYDHDRGKCIIIDFASKSIQIIQGPLQRRVNFDDIERIVLTRGVKHSKTILHNYFYFQLDLRNKEVLYLTSLLLDENDLSPLPIKANTSVFPTIRYFEGKETMSHPDKVKIEDFKVKYQSKEDQELIQITSDKRFIEEAKIAAADLLAERLKNRQQELN